MNRDPAPQANRSGLFRPARLDLLSRSAIVCVFILFPSAPTIVTYAYGRRGSTLTTGTKSDLAIPLETATKLFNKLITSKIAKG